MVYYGERILVQYDSVEDETTADSLKYLLEIKGYVVDLIKTSSFPYDRPYDTLIVVGAQEANPGVYGFLVNLGLFRNITPYDEKKIIIQDVNYAGYHILSCAGWSRLDTNDILNVIVGRFENKTKQYDILRFQTVITSTGSILTTNFLTDVRNRIENELYKNGYIVTVREILMPSDYLAYINLYAVVPYGTAEIIKPTLAPVIAVIIILVLIAAIAWGVFAVPSITQYLLLDSRLKHSEELFEYYQKMRNDQLEACEKQGLTPEQCKPYLDAIDANYRIAEQNAQEAYERSQNVLNNIFEAIPMLITLITIAIIAVIIGSIISVIRGK
jgi:hypothetical protein